MDTESTTIFKSNIKQRKIPSCVLSIDDLRKLFEILENKASEAAKIEADNLQLQPPNITPENIENLKTYIKDIIKLNVHIFGNKGEFIAAQHKHIFDDGNIPEDIQKIIFNNSFLFNSIMKKMPANYFEVLVDFSKIQLLDFSTSPDRPTLNNSNITVTGNNETWVTGVYQKIVDFFEDKKVKRNWLHSKNIYLLFLYGLIFPLAFRSLFRIDTYLQPLMSNVSKIFITAFYIYIFILSLFIYRFLFNYARWVFTPIEFKSKDSRIRNHRRILTTVLGTLGLAFLYDLLKFIFNR